MTAIKSPLSVADIAGIVETAASASAARELYAAVEAAAHRTCGFVLFTILVYVEADSAVERVYSSNEAAYPVGGRKQLSSITMNHREMDNGKVFLAADRAQVQSTYPDHDLIFSLGITAILNAPIRHLGKRYGTLNLSGVEGGYDESDKQKAALLAGLLAPALLRRG